MRDVRDHLGGASEGYRRGLELAGQRARYHRGVGLDGASDRAALGDRDLLRDDIAVHLARNHELAAADYVAGDLEIRTEDGRRNVAAAKP